MPGRHLTRNAEISSMPKPIQLITYLVPARYFVSSLKTLFLAGTVWSVVLPDIAAMLAISAVIYALIARRTVKRLD